LCLCSNAVKLCDLLIMFMFRSTIIMPSQHITVTPITYSVPITYCSPPHRTVSTYHRYSNHIFCSNHLLFSPAPHRLNTSPLLQSHILFQSLIVLLRTAPSQHITVTPITYSVPITYCSPPNPTALFTVQNCFIVLCR
jgi:hypothetical protein